MKRWTLGTSAVMASHEAHDDGWTLGTIGIAAYLLADIVHEVIGHGTACLMHGARITLLTSVYFRCSARTPFIAAAGPTANLVAAGLAWFVQRRSRIVDPALRLLTRMTFAFNRLVFVPYAAAGAAACVAAAFTCPIPFEQCSKRYSRRTLRVSV